MERSGGNAGIGDKNDNEVTTEHGGDNDREFRSESAVRKLRHDDTNVAAQNVSTRLPSFSQLIKTLSSDHHLDASRPVQWRHEHRIAPQSPDGRIGESSQGPVGGVL